VADFILAHRRVRLGRSVYFLHRSVAEAAAAACLLTSGDQLSVPLLTWPEDCSQSTVAFDHGQLSLLAHPCSPVSGMGPARSEFSPPPLSQAEVAGTPIPYLPTSSPSSATPAEGTGFCTPDGTARMPSRCVTNSVPYPLTSKSPSFSLPPPDLATSSAPTEHGRAAAPSILEESETSALPTGLFHVHFFF
jgi:hypothetical protein